MYGYRNGLNRSNWGARRADCQDLPLVRAVGQPYNPQPRVELAKLQMRILSLGRRRGDSVRASTAAARGGAQATKPRIAVQRAMPTAETGLTHGSPIRQLRSIQSNRLRPMAGVEVTRLGIWGLRSR